MRCETLQCYLGMEQQTNPQENFNQSAKKVVIIGAGLGGLAVAIALRKLGYEIQVYEKAQDFRPVGGGLGLLPNGLNCLDAIEPGIVETIKQSACEVSTTFLKNTQGETIRTNSASRYKEQYGQPLITVWWWRLQQVLASYLPSDSIHLNYRCLGFEQDEDGVSIYFENSEKVSADCLIGADGIHSVIRKELIGDGEPRYLGSMSWRAVIHGREDILDLGELGFVKGDQEFMYLLNVGQGDLAWLYRKWLPDFPLSQNTDEAKSRLLEYLTHWGESLRSVVEATPAEQIMENPIYDRLPVSSWSHRRVTLLGDAAHAMAPALAQGSNTTFEDAYELALCFSQASSIQQALADYEKRRISRIQLIQNCSALGEKRYYATKQEQEEINQQMQEQSSMSREEFQNWLQNYKPSYQLN